MKLNTQTATKKELVDFMLTDGGQKRLFKPDADVLMRLSRDKLIEGYKIKLTNMTNEKRVLDVLKKVGRNDSLMLEGVSHRAKMRITNTAHALYGLMAKGKVKETTVDGLTVVYSIK